MEPALRRGDWLLVDPAAYRRRAPRAGDVVVARDPRQPSRVLVKRVAGSDADGSIRLAGDAADASTDSRAFGPLPREAIGGRVWLRYWPPGRIGRVG